MEHTSDILKELQELAPQTRWPSRNMTFHVPDGYFDQLTARVLGEVGPASKSPEHKPFDLPAGYFDQLPERMVERIRDEQAASGRASSGKLFTLFFRKAVPYAAAALLGGVLVTGAFIFTDQRPGIGTERGAAAAVTASHTVLSPDNELYKDISLKMQSLSDDEINRYLEENTSTETLEWQPDEIN